MSYILDALRRADADRVRAEGRAPGLQAVLSPALDRHGDAPRAGPPAWAWLAGGLALGGAVAAAVALWWARPGDTAAALSPAVQPVQPVQAVPPVQPLQSAAPAVPPVAEARPADAALPAPQADPPPAAPRPARKPAAAAKPPASAAAARGAAPLAASAVPVPVAPAPAPAPAIVQLASVSALPAGSPALSFGGSVYSAAPAQRLLIVNGQVLHEGASLGANATLESIGPRSAVLLIRGQRYEVPY